MNVRAPTPTLEVALLATEQSTPTALHGLLEIFAAVGVSWAEITGEPSTCLPIRSRIVARSRDAIASPIGVTIMPHETLDPFAKADIVIVSDLSLDIRQDALPDWQREAEWLAAQYRAGAVICSVCTGSLLLARAGLLDGQEATTHWSATAFFAHHFPQVKLRTERILCPTGEGHRIVTSGGSASWEDLALYLIGRFCGATEAVRIAKIFVLGDRSDGQVLFSALGRPREHNDRVIASCQSWLAENYAEPNPVARMVALSKLPERTFKRRFNAATGFTPVEYALALRIEEAKHMLETSGEPVDAIADAVGYSDPTFFRRLFKRKVGVTPSRYRQHFQRLTRPST